MQAMLRQQGTSLISVPRPVEAGARSLERGFDAADRSRLRRGAWVPAKRNVRGFTMIELMVTIGVAAVLLVIAIPSFQNLTLSNRLTTTANDVIAAINTARIEAVKLNASTQLCSDSATLNTSDTLGAKCGTQAGAVYAMTGTQATAITTNTIGIASPLQLSGNLVALRFTSAGLAQTAGTTIPFNGQVVDICTSAMSSNNHRRINMAVAGSVITTTSYSGACP